MDGCGGAEGIAHKNGKNLTEDIAEQGVHSIDLKREGVVERFLHVDDANQ